MGNILWEKMKGCAVIKTGDFNFKIPKIEQIWEYNMYIWTVFSQLKYSPGILDGKGNWSRIIQL